MRYFLILLAFPAIALAGTFTGTILDFQSQPVSGATVRIGSDSVTTTANGTWTLARSTGIASRARKTASVTSHISLENGRGRLSFGGMDIRGRCSNKPASGQLPSNVAAARSRTASDTLRVYWKGTYMLRLLLEDSTSDVQTVRIDTLWEGGNYFWNPLSKPGTVAARDGRTHLRTVTFDKLTWTVDMVVWNLQVYGINNKTAELCPVGFDIPSRSQWNAILDSLGQNKWIQDTLVSLGFPISTSFLAGTPYSNPSNGSFIQVDVIEPYNNGDRSYDVWIGGRTQYGSTNLRCVKETP